MLNTAIFEQGLESIENTYIGKKFTVKYIETQYAQWYKLLSHLSDEAYMQAIDEWCSSQDSLPTPANLLEFSGRLRTQNNNVVIPKNTKHCSACGNRGVVSQIEFNPLMHRDYEMLYACVCEAGAYYRDKGLFKTLTKEDWEKGKVHKTQCVKENAKNDAGKVNVNKIVTQFSMI